MRILPIVAVLSAAVFLSACDEEVACTQADAEAKVAELTTKITELATTNPAKLAELQPKIQEIATKAAAGGEDLPAACKALDEMMAELAG